MTNPVQVELADVGGVLILRLSGELRLDMTPLERQLIRLSAGRPAVVVIDLAGLSFISSLGMGYLNNFRRGVKPYGGVVKIAAAQPLVDQALRLCNFHQLFEFHDSVEAALGARAAS
jgi:anti-anti-sigma factor